MNDDQLLRYSRHILLDELGIEGQERLLAAHAVIVGAGGLGSPAALYLAASGVGRITLIDDDEVDVRPAFLRRKDEEAAAPEMPVAASVKRGVASGSLVETPNPKCGLCDTRADALLAARLTFGPEAALGEDFEIKKTGVWTLAD